MVTTKEMVITPEMALDMLKLNTRNRPLLNQRVMFFVNQMVKGTWRFNGESIIFGKGNVLIDGQNRLAAIVKSKIPQRMIIVEGIDPDTFDTIDTGFNRSGADIIAINNGGKYAAIISSSITAYGSFLRNNTSNAHRQDLKMTKHDILMEFQKSPELWENIAGIARRLNDKLKLIKTSTLAGYIAYLVKEKKHSLEKVESFFNQLFSGSNIENETILLLREKLIRDISGQYKMTQPFRHGLIVKTWNFYVTGKEVKSLRYNQETETTPVFI